MKNDKAVADEVEKLVYQSYRDYKIRTVEDSTLYAGVDAEVTVKATKSCNGSALLHMHADGAYSLMGFDFMVDTRIPDGTLELRSAGGVVLGRITNLGLGD